MPSYIDLSLRITDPLDDSRLFAIGAEAQTAQALYRPMLPQQEGGRALLAPPLYYQLAAGTADVRAVNDFVLDEAEAQGALLGAFCTVEPKYGDHAVRELERVAARGAKGVVWSPRAQGLFGDDATLIALHRQAHALGLRSIFRSEPYSLNEALWRGWTMARACPEAPLIISGALGAWDNVQAIVGMKGGADNIVYDTAELAPTVSLAPLVALLGADRFLFATGGLERADTAAARVEAQLRENGAGEDVVEAILWRNAARLLGLEEGL